MLNLAISNICFVRPPGRWSGWMAHLVVAGTKTLFRIEHATLLGWFCLAFLARFSVWIGLGFLCHNRFVSGHQNSLMYALRMRYIDGRPWNYATFLNRPSSPAGRKCWSAPRRRTATWRTSSSPCSPCPASCPPAVVGAGAAGAAARRRPAVSSGVLRPTSAHRPVAVSTRKCSHVCWQTQKLWNW